jgi:hypothetical protein
VCRHVDVGVDVDTGNDVDVNASVDAGGDVGVDERGS